MRTKLWTLGLCCLLLLCPSLDAKDKKTHYEPLFGKALASYSVTSNSLKGAVFYLVSILDVLVVIRGKNFTKMNMHTILFSVWDGNF